MGRISEHIDCVICKQCALNKALHLTATAFNIIHINN